MRRLVLAALVLLAGAPAAATPPRPAPIDLARLRPFEGKGRVQDRANHLDPLVDRLVDLAPPAIPLDVDAVADTRPLPCGFMEHWHDFAVGDAAVVLLLDLWTAPDGTACVPGGDWEGIVGTDPERGAEANYRRLLARIGREGLQRTLRALWRKYDGRFSWDAEDRCFRPAAAAR